MILGRFPILFENPDSIRKPRLNIYNYYNGQRNHLVKYVRNSRASDQIKSNIRGVIQPHEHTADIM